MVFDIRNLASAARAGAGEKIVDLSEEPAKAKVLRQGFDVPQAKLDARKVDQFIGDLGEVPTRELPKVVSQSVAQGTKVPVGTVVDLVLAPRNRIPWDIFTGVHMDLAGKTLDAVDPLFSDAAARKTLLTYTSADAVPTAEKALLQTRFQQVGITVDESDPNKTFAKAFESARGGVAFFG
jgi:hypothetical protein